MKRLMINSSWCSEHFSSASIFSIVLLLSTLLIFPSFALAKHDDCNPDQQCSCDTRSPPERPFNCCPYVASDPEGSPPCTGVFVGETLDSIYSTPEVARHQQGPPNADCPMGGHLCPDECENGIPMCEAICDSFLAALQAICNAAVAGGGGSVTYQGATAGCPAGQHLTGCEQFRTPCSIVACRDCTYCVVAGFCGIKIHCEPGEASSSSSSSSASTEVFLKR